MGIVIVFVTPPKQTETAVLLWCSVTIAWDSSFQPWITPLWAVAYQVASQHRRDVKARRQSLVGIQPLPSQWAGPRLFQGFQRIPTPQKAIIWGWSKVTSMRCSHVLRGRTQAAAIAIRFGNLSCRVYYHYHNHTVIKMVSPFSWLYPHHDFAKNC